MTTAGPLMWITGAAGFIGSHIARRARAEGFRTVEMGRGAKDYDTALDGPMMMRALRDHGVPDVVVHAAGPGSVGRAEAEPKRTWIDIVGASMKLRTFLERHAPRAWVIYTSSCAVYGGLDAPHREDALLLPVSHYGRFKLQSEKILLTSSLPVVCLRLFPVYGRGLRARLPWDLGRKLLHAKHDRWNLNLDGTGQEQRDFVHVDDVADAVMRLSTDAFPTGLVCNIGTGTTTTVAEFARLMRKLMAVPTPLVFTGRARPVDPFAYVADTALQRAHGLEASVSLPDGLTDYVRWLTAVTGPHSG